jgi:DNA-binding transcriptional ArsR family regulator
VGATFGELCEETGLTPPAVSGHLKRLLREGLVEKIYDGEFDRDAYVISETKNELVRLLGYFIEQHKLVAVQYDTQLARLRKAASELEEALKPFGKLPPEIRKLQDEWHKTVEKLSKPRN